MHDDLQMMRQLEMEKCFLDKQIPCRWVPDMGYGFGFPLFNYYPPLPYLFGEIFRIFGFSFVNTVKIVFLLSFLASGITMYFLAKEFWGKLGAVISAVFYVWAPYHAVDVYVRGAMNEAWALIWFPAILLSAYKVIRLKFKRINLIALTLSWAGLLLSHNLMVVIFAPVFAAWCLLWWVRSPKKQVINSVLRLAMAGLTALSLTAFFTLPAFFEQKYVQVGTLVAGYYEYIAHFVSTSQLLFSRFWGYGPSVWGTGDEMPFQIGHLHWILTLIILGLGLYRVFSKRPIKDGTRRLLPVVLFFFAAGWFAAFMAHVRSTFIWQALPFLKFVQFPWRFLTLVILAFSFLAGAITLLFPKKFLTAVAGLLLGGVLLLNWSYFLPEYGKMGPLTDVQKFSEAAWDLQRTAGIFDYLPKAAKENPKGPQTTLAEVMAGKGEVADQKQGTDWGSFRLKVESQSAKVRINIFDFPNWEVTVDGQKIAKFVPEEEKWGRIWVEISSGEHSVRARLVNTPIRVFGNIVSAMAWVGLTAYLVLQFKRGRKH
jgi:hypothetical protein